MLHLKFDCGIYFCQTTFFESFWGTLGIKWGSKRVISQLPISLKIPPEAANLQREIISHDNRATRVSNGGQKLPTLLKKPH